MKVQLELSIGNAELLKRMIMASWPKCFKSRFWHGPIIVR